MNYEEMTEIEKLNRLADVLMEALCENISTGKAREILRAQGYPEEVTMRILAPPQP